MIGLPFTPATAGETMLAAYLRSNPARLPVLQTIMARLDDDGRVGDTARYYIVRSTFRRAVLRAALIALGFALPSWSLETRTASVANRAFIDMYREQERQHRRDRRKQRDR